MSSNEIRALPLAWVDKIFAVLTGRFGRRFTEVYRDGDAVEVDGKAADRGIESAKRIWAVELTGLSGEEVARGLAHKYKFPPSCDDFLLACRPDVYADLESLFYRAGTEMRKRRSNEAQDWPEPRLFWAAAKLGNDLLNVPYAQLRGRWAEAWRWAECRADMPVPDVLPESALPPPGKTTLSAPEVEKRMQGMRDKLANVRLSSRTLEGLQENVCSGRESPFVSEVSAAILRQVAPRMLDKGNQDD